MAVENRSKFWDIIVVRQDGEWLGFRAPFQSLRRTASFFGLLLVLCMLATTGWLVTRWKAHRLSGELASERLKANSLELQLNDIRERGKGGLPLSTGEAINQEALKAFTLLPSLDGDELSSPLIELNEQVAEYEAPTQELNVKFEVVRKPPRDVSMRFYWLALLHGPQGLMSLPPALASRSGETVLFHRGQAIDDVKIRRAVNARFKISDFVERAGSEPMFVSLLIYDNKGSLMLRKRMELFMRRSGVRIGN
jgi:hypothetical protein